MTFDDFLDTLDRCIASQQHIVNGIKAPMIRRALSRGMPREDMGNLMRVAFWIAGSNEEGGALETFLRGHPDTYGEKDSTWVELATEMVRRRRDEESRPQP
jgi:hypothetical protein